MHRTTASPADSVRLPHQLGHQRVELRALADRVAVRTVRAGHVVIRAKGHAGPDDGRLLSGARVAAAGNEPGTHGFADRLLEIADTQYSTQTFDLLFAGEAHDRIPNDILPSLTVL